MEKKEQPILRISVSINGELIVQVGEDKRYSFEKSKDFQQNFARFFDVMDGILASYPEWRQASRAFRKAAKGIEPKDQ
jgi:hypothetical protein